MMSCLELGKTDEGVSVASTAVELEPNNAGLWANMSLALLLNAQLSKAKQAAEKALEIDSSDQITKNLLMAISQVQMESGRSPEKCLILLGDFVVTRCGLTMPFVPTGQAALLRGTSMPVGWQAAAQWRRYIAVQ